MTDIIPTAADLTAEEVVEIRLRQKHRASVSQVARHLGVSNLTVIQVERGGNCNLYGARQSVRGKNVIC